MANTENIPLLNDLNYIGNHRKTNGFKTVITANCKGLKGLTSKKKKHIKDFCSLTWQYFLNVLNDKFKCIVLLKTS